MCAHYVCSFRIFLPDSHLLWSYSTTSPCSFYYLPLHCPTLLVISHAFYTHAACFKCLKMCVFALLCHAPLCFHKKDIYFPSQWAACVVQSYIYICIYFVVLGKGYLTFVACLQSLNFSLADFFCCFFVFASFFRSVGLFFGKVVERAEPSRKEEQAQAEARHLCDPVDNMDQNTKSRSGRTAAAAGSRQQATCDRMRQLSNISSC